MLGPTFGYGSKTHLVVKPEHEETVRQLFTDTDVNISIEGKRHLGAALGSRTFTEEYVTNKVQGWTQEITRLAEIATTQPHAAYAAFTHGLSSRWSYISRTIPDVLDLLLDCYPPMSDPSPHWPSTLLQTGTRPPRPPSQAWRLGAN